MGKNIKRIRQEKGMTQAQLGDFLGIDYQAVSRIEAGRTNPSFFLLVEISKGLNVSTLQLINTKPFN